MPGAYTFFPGYICNLACVSCGPDASTRWQKEQQQVMRLDNPTELSAAVKAQLPDVRSVVVCGGEPMLNRSTFALLEQLDADVDVRVHFNGTVPANQRMFDLACRFHSISFGFSIDAIGDQFEYLRWPAKWHRASKNFTWMFEHAPGHVSFAVVIVVSDLNRDVYHAVEQWTAEHLPTDQQGRSTAINLNHTNCMRVSYLDRIDQQRNTNWRAVFPQAVDRIEQADAIS